MQSCWPRQWTFVFLSACCSVQSCPASTALRAIAAGRQCPAPETGVARWPVAMVCHHSCVPGPPVALRSLVAHRRPCPAVCVAVWCARAHTPVQSHTWVVHSGPPAPAAHCGLRRLLRSSGNNVGCAPAQPRAPLLPARSRALSPVRVACCVTRILYPRISIRRGPI